jgi:hypothetical protein
VFVKFFISFIVTIYLLIKKSNGIRNVYQNRDIIPGGSFPERAQKIIVRFKIAAVF